MNSILELLAGGDRRSIGRSDEVVRLVLRQPEKFTELFQGFYIDDPIIRMRTADAVEKITAINPQLLFPHKQAILDLVEQVSQIEVQWHLAQIIPRLPLDQKEIGKSYSSIEKYLESSSAIVRAFSLQCLFDLSKKDSGYINVTKQYLEKGLQNSSKAIQSRCRTLLKEIKKL